MSSDEPLVLGIETSCDETGIGIVRGTTLLADEVASSVDEHARYGGVVPEVASRAHLEAMVPTMERALRTAGVRLADVDAIAVTAGPGLAGALLVGVAAAKGYAVAAEKPIYGVNHLAAHVAVDTLEHGPLPSPSVALLVSGGHSSLLLVNDLAHDVRPLGATIDDAAGELVHEALLIAERGRGTFGARGRMRRFPVMSSLRPLGSIGLTGSGGGDLSCGSHRPITCIIRGRFEVGLCGPLRGTPSPEPLVLTRVELCGWSLRSAQLFAPAACAA